MWNAIKEKKVREGKKPLRGPKAETKSEREKGYSAPPQANFSGHEDEGDPSFLQTQRPPSNLKLKKGLISVLKNAPAQHDKKVQNRRGRR